MKEYRETFDYLTDCVLPRRKFAPENFLTTLYFCGSSMGARAWAVLARSPLTVFWHGLRDGWREYR
jgi:hypothetical protein